MVTYILGANCKFLTCWQGPYTILKQVGPVNRQLGKRVYHINLWIKCIKHALVLSAFLSSDPSDHAFIQKGEDLTPSQWQDLTELVDQFAVCSLQNETLLTFFFFWKTAEGLSLVSPLIPAACHIAMIFTVISHWLIVLCWIILLSV